MGTLTTQSSMSLFLPDGTTNDQLKVAYAAITDQIQKSALSLLLKNNDLSGNPMSGSVVVRRLQTAGVQDEGTARAAGKGDVIKNNGVNVLLDQHKEIVEEINKFDLQQYGLAGMVERRATGFGLKLASYLDTAFFAQAVTDGTSVTLLGNTVADRIEALIQSVENTENNNVDGVDRSMIKLTLDTATYGQLNNYIDKLANPSNNGVITPTFHGVRIYSNTRQTVEAICMVDGSIAQPTIVIDFATGDIPLSPDIALQLFFHTGTKAVMPDLIKYSNTAEVSA